MTGAPLISKAQFTRSLWRAVVPLLLLLVAQAALLTLLLMYWMRSSEWVRHTEAVIARANDIERHLVNMETGLRGYMLTADPKFYEPFERSRARIKPAIEGLRADLTDSKVQTDRLDAISHTLHEWLALGVELGTPRAGEGTTEAQLKLLRLRKSSMDDMRRHIQELILTESELMSTRAGSEAFAAKAGVIGGIGLSVLIGIGLALVSRRTVLGLVATYQESLDAQVAAMQQFGDLAEAIPQLVWVSDATGKHLYFNSLWSTFIGKQQSDLASRGWEQSVHPDDAAAATQLWKEALSTGKPFESEYRLKCAEDGSYRWFLCRASPVLDKSGKRARWFGTCTDVETQKQLEAQREQALAAERAARSDLLRTSRVKDEFLATLSHELRTPMTAILGWARLLREPKSRERNLDRAIESIETNARVQAKLIDELLDMSRIISGKLALAPECCDLVQITRTAVDGLMPAATNKRVRLAVQLPDRVEVNGDPARLQQILWNLLSNAVKFTPAGGKVLVELVPGDSSVLLSVSDSGRGIDPAFLPHVFDRFRQADGTTTRQHGGLGLGLAITKNLVELHGGSVGVSSDGPDKGATFTVELPLALTSVTGGCDDEPASGSSDWLTALRDVRALIVDDSPDTAHVICVMLENADMKPVAAHSGEQALQILAGAPFDVLLSDIGMPGMDGYALIRRVREREQATGGRMCAIALTAFARPEDRQAALDAGYDDHISKPVTPDDLYRVITATLGRDVASA